MINKSYLNNIPDPQTNMLHDSKEGNLINLFYDSNISYEVNSLILNSNLENSNLIK